jgi:hypothetical protein
MVNDVSRSEADVRVRPNAFRTYSKKTLLERQTEYTGDPVTGCHMAHQGKKLPNPHLPFRTSD